MAAFSNTVHASLLLAVCYSALYGSVRGEVPAFPGAEGQGATVTGGRGGEVYFVTNLEDSGPGSLRDAVSKSNRIVLFEVSGTILLQSDLILTKSNITIAGQSAPGDGICLRGSQMIIHGDNIIVRFLRLRPGPEDKRELDALTVNGADGVMIDHCSMSWSTDSVVDVVQRTSDVTVQWCIVSEPLNQSVHHKGAHGYGTGWGSGRDSGNSFHHNLLAHCNSRAPRLGSERGARVDVRNNVIYNTGGGWAYGGENAHVNYVANYFRPGPDTVHTGAIFRVSSPKTRMFLAGNVAEGSAGIASDNTKGVLSDDGISLDEIVVDSAFDMASVHTDTAEEAYDKVLQYAGAVLPKRDTVDRRIASEVAARGGKVIDSPEQVGGWPMLERQPRPPDSDHDGLPDAWETARGLRSDDSSDALQRAPEGYTFLETYLNERAATAYPKSWTPHSSATGVKEN